MDDSNLPEPVRLLLRLGRPNPSSDDWRDYRVFGLTEDHVSVLIDMMSDEELNQADASDAKVWAPVHAWRALAQLQAVEAFEPFVESLIDNSEDDWRHDDAPYFFALLGPTLVAKVAELLADDLQDEYVRWAMAIGLRRMAERHPDVHSECVRHLMAELEQFERNPDDLNAGIIAELVTLKAVEAAPLMERAFASGNVEESLNGPWGYVQYELGLRPDRPEWRSPRPLFNLPSYAGLAATPADRAKKRAKKRRKEVRAARKRNRR